VFHWGSEGDIIKLLTLIVEKLIVICYDVEFPEFLDWQIKA
jgi:hypothetical protein